MKELQLAGPGLRMDLWELEADRMWQVALVVTAEAARIRRQTVGRSPTMLVAVRVFRMGLQWWRVGQI
jgi:hypothetical protein